MDTYEIKADNVRDRINQLLKEKEITENAASSGDRATQKRLNNQLSHGAAITLDTVLRILDVFPDVSADWLLRGLDDDSKKIANSITGASSVTGENITINGQQCAILSENFVRDMLAEKDKQIHTLMELLKK